jgi:predicted AAA+ superfamily ATPase
MKEIFKIILKDLQKSLPRTGVRERELQVPLDSKKIISLIGPRRCGKTFYAFQLINQLFAQGHSDRIIYINFEDERLDLTAGQLHLILEAYYELYPENYGKELYLFFDEIQEIDGWEKFIRRLYDTVSFNIFLTGSSAKMLGKEIASSLRGRNLVYHLYPLSFPEYCQFQDLDIKDLYSTQARAMFKSQFETYLQGGGYPETVFMDEELSQKTLQSYFEGMLFHDIVQRYQISNVLVLKQFLKKILNNISQTLSVHKFYNELKSQGIPISKNAIYEFLDYSIDCFLLFVLHPFEPSIVRQQMRARKAYAIDTGLVNAVTYRFSEDKGKLLENIVFLQLIREEGNRVSYLNDRKECDFVIQKNQSVTNAIQVCWSLSDETTRKREIRGLLHAAKKFGLHRGYIITFDEEDELDIEGIRIRILPCWKWLLKRD